MPRAIHANFYDSSQEILVAIMNPPVGQLVTYLPNKYQPNAEQFAHVQQ